MKLTEAHIAELRRAAEIYYPCNCGVHICGDLDGAAATFGNIPVGTEAEARRVFAACRAETECRENEPGEFVVDLNISRDNQHVEDFSISRQMLERCLSAGRAALAGE